MIGWRSGLDPTYRPSMGEYHFVLDREIARDRREEGAIEWQSTAVLAVVRKLDAIGKLLAGR